MPADRVGSQTTHTQATTPEQKKHKKRRKKSKNQSLRVFRVTWRITARPAHADAMSQRYCVFDHAVADAEDEHSGQRWQVHLHVPHQQRVRERVASFRTVAAVDSATATARGRVLQRLREGCAGRVCRLQDLRLVCCEHVHVQP
jgi:hypothetical protein